MTQYINVELSIEIPEDMVLVKKIELEELIEQQLVGVYWSMKDLEKRINKKQEWIKENILYPTKFRNILDVNKGGFVYYPKSKGQTWAFQATKMAKFLDDNFHKIYGNI